MRALNEKDPELQASVTTEEGTIAWLAYRDGKPVSQTRSFAEGLAPLTNHEGDWYEVYWEPTVLVRGDIAVANPSAGVEAGFGESTDGGIYDPFKCGRDLFFASLVALFVFFWRLECKRRPFDDVGDDQLTIVDPFRYAFGKFEGFFPRTMTIESYY